MSPRSRRAASSAHAGTPASVAAVAKGRSASRRATISSIRDMRPSTPLRGAGRRQNPLRSCRPPRQRGCVGGQRSCHLAPEEIQLGESQPDSEDEIREVVAPRVRESLREDGPRSSESPGVGQRESEIDLDGGAGMRVLLFVHPVERALEERNRSSRIPPLQVERAQGGLGAGGPGLLLECGEGARGALELALGKREFPLKRGHGPLEIVAQRSVERLVPAGDERGSGIAGGRACLRAPADVEERLRGDALNILEEAYRQKSAIDVECGLWIGFQFGFTADYFDILCRLSDAEWHMRHEDVVSALGGLRDARAVEALYRASLKVHLYLDYDDSRALAVKAIWALSGLRDPAADEKLRLLAQSDVPIVKENASDQLRYRQKQIAAGRRA